MIVGTFAIALLPLGCIWLFSGVVLRVSGAGFAVLALLGLALSPGSSAGGAVILLALATAMWLAGHWLFALRHHAYKSPLVQRVFPSVAPASPRSEPQLGHLRRISIIRVRAPGVAEGSAILQTRR